MAAAIVIVRMGGGSTTTGHDVSSREGVPVEDHDGEAPSSLAIGDADGVTVAQAQHTPQVMLGVVVDRHLTADAETVGIETVGIDEHVSARRAQHRSVEVPHQRPRLRRTPT